MKSLKRVQKIARVVSVFDHIAFWLSLVGTLLCCISGFVMLFVPFIGEKEFEIIKRFTDSYTLNDMALLLIADSVFMLGDLVAAFFACRYFDNELEDGTPFTHRGAKELRRLGIITIFAPMISLMISCVVCSIAGIENTLSNEIEVISGIWMIIFSYIFAYGADLENKKATEYDECS